MSIDPKYSIKKDIRNNPVVRGADDRQARQYLRTVLLVVVTVATLVLSVWQHTEHRLIGYEIEALRERLAEEQSVQRKLQLNLESLRAPKEVERRARQLGMRPARIDEVTVIELVDESGSPDAVVARAEAR